jgi:DNA-directed RNA polymerase III subunit RPC6
MTVDMCRFKGLTSEDMLVYQAIQQAANTGIFTYLRMLMCSFIVRLVSMDAKYISVSLWGCIGIWTADLKKRTNLQQLQVNKALKNLESRSLVKPVKTVSVIPFFYHCRLLISVQGWFKLT